MRNIIFAQHKKSLPGSIVHAKCFSKLTEEISREKHLLAKTAEELKRQFDLGLSIVAIIDGAIIAHATL